MVHIEGEIVIRRPVEDVFDCVADTRNEPQYNPNMLKAKKLSTGPLGVGTRFEAESQTFGGTVAMTIEITAFDWPRRITSSTHLSSMDIQGTLTFGPVLEGTLMRWYWDVQPRGMYKLLTPMIARMGTRQEETIWTGLKHYLEEQAP